MDVTVIIVNWNSGSVLRQCLDALSAQTVAPKKILIVDNNSTDDSIRYIPQIDPIEVMPMNANLGFASANNIAIDNCETEYIALLNPDAFPEPDWLESLLNKASDNPEIASFGSRQMQHDFDDLIDGIGDKYHFSGLVWRHCFRKKLSEVALKPAFIFSPCAAAALYKTSVLKQLGGFDDDFFCYIEDIDLGFRLQLMGFKCLYVPEAIVHHIGAVSSGSNTDTYIYYGQRNIVWAFCKNMPGHLFWLFLPVHISLNIFSILYFSLHGKGKIAAKAKWDALIGLSEIMIKRKTVQDKRVVSLRYILQILDKGLLPRISSRCK